MRKLLTNTVTIAALSTAAITGGAGVANASDNGPERNGDQQNTRVTDQAEDFGNLSFDDLLDGSFDLGDLFGGNAFSGNRADTSDRGNGNFSGNGNGNEAGNGNFSGNEVGNGTLGGNQTGNGDNANGNEVGSGDVNIAPDIEISPETDGSQQDNSETNQDNSQSDSSETNRNGDRDRSTDQDRNDQSSGLLDGLLG